MAGFISKIKKLTVQAISDAGGAKKSDLDLLSSGPVAQVVYNGARILRVSATDMLNNSGFILKAGIYSFRDRQTDLESWSVVVPDINKNHYGMANPQVSAGHTEVWYSFYNGSLKSVERKYLSPSGGNTLTGIGYVEYLPFT